MIAPAIRAELDQSMAWWTGLYHQALDASGAEVVEGETWDIKTWSGTAYTWTERGFPDCSCRECRRICG